MTDSPTPPALQPDTLWRHILTAERLFGPGTGQEKLKFVEDMICGDNTDLVVRHAVQRIISLTVQLPVSQEALRRLKQSGASCCALTR